MAEDLETRRKIAKEGRLYLLALVCATTGALTIYFTDRVVMGIFAFLVAVLVCGPILYTYEKRHQKRLKK